MVKQRSWRNIHGFATVQHWARCIGYRIAIPSERSASLAEGKARSARKWYTYYGALIKRFNLVPMKVDGYTASIFVGGCAQATAAALPETPVTEEILLPSA